jgi:DNA-binding CsgD family transcriptional regulator
MARAIPLSHDKIEGLWRRSLPHRKALLLVVDLDAEALTASENALRLLGLTPAEARVAALVGCGRSPREAAAEMGTSEGTVRNQLKQVFSKTETSRQTELIQLVQGLSVPT